MKTDQKIQDMLRKVAKRKTELAELAGEKRQIQKQMADESCESAEDIEREIEKEVKQAAKIEEEMAAEVESLEDEYDWS